MGALIFLGVIVAAVVFFVAIYNSLVQLRNRVKNAWSQIDVQLKRRYDLIPNLVETAKGYMAHERETLSAITDARSRAMGAGTVHDKSAAEAQLSGAISRFMVFYETAQKIQQEVTTAIKEIVGMDVQAINVYIQDVEYPQPAPSAAVVEK